MQIDHVIYAAEDLDEAAELIEATLGLRAVAGGYHEQLGTRNMIVPLGGGYLELMTVADPSVAERSEIAAALQRRLRSGAGRLIQWSVVVEDIASVAERLDTPVVPVTREGLSARVAGLGEALADPSLPFFIERDPGVPDPGESGDAGGISWIEVSGDEWRLDAWLGGEELPLRLSAGAPAVRAIGIGRREFRPPRRDR